MWLGLETPQRLSRTAAIAQSHVGHLGGNWTRLRTPGLQGWASASGLMAAVLYDIGHNAADVVASVGALVGTPAGCGPAWRQAFNNTLVSVTGCVVCR